MNFVDPDGKSWGKAAKVVKKVYKAAKAGNKVSVKGILKSEALDIADNLRTLFDSDASGFEKGIAAFDLATGFGDEVKGFAKAVGVSDSIVDGAKAFNGQSDTFSKTANKAFRMKPYSNQEVQSIIFISSQFIFKNKMSPVVRTHFYFYI